MRLMIFLLAAGGLILSPPPYQGLAAAEDAPPALKIAEDDVLPGFMGLVQEVTDKHMVIKPQGNIKFTWTHFGANGRPVAEYEVKQDNSGPPKKFVYSHQTLATNGTLPKGVKLEIQNAEGGRGQHKLSEVRPGDLVLISCERIKGENVCYAIEIHRRPGGRVPPAIGDDKQENNRRIDVQRNADQEREELSLRCISKVLLRLAR